jgi:hypothetical protein
MLNGAEAEFVANTDTFYRQYGGNTASVTEMSDERIFQGVKIKRQHYEALRESSLDYKLRYEIYRKLEDRLTADKNFADLYYLSVCKNAPTRPLWWEAIKTPQELNLC